MEEDTALRGAAAHKAIRKNFPALLKAITQRELPENLYAREVIDDDGFAIATNPVLTPKEKGLKILPEIRRAVQVNPKVFDELCSALKEDKHLENLSQKLQDEYKKSLGDQKRKKESASGKQEFEKLKVELQVYMQALSREDGAKKALLTCIQQSLDHYINNALRAGVNMEPLKKQVWSLCYEEFLIPFTLHEWALQRVEQISRKLLSAGNTQPVSVPLEASETSQSPLFCPDAVYHASMCCHAVSTCTAGTVQKFFDHHALGHHHLGEVSMSFSQDKGSTNKYLIAKQKNTIYVAFQSETTISAWLNNYESFDDGLEKQTDCIPLRFFIEQLWDNNRIVLTGFSFGGMLACCVAATIWKRSFISTHILVKRVACITFGQPLLHIPYVQEVIMGIPDFATTIHSVFNKDDIVPRLLRYFHVGCLHYHSGSRAVRAILPDPSNKQPLKSAVSPSEGGIKTPFQGAFASAFLQNLDVLLQEPTYSGVVQHQGSPRQNGKAQALRQLKSVLTKVIPYANAEIEPPFTFGTTYVISCEKGEGLMWKQMPKELATQDLGCFNNASVEKLESTLFKKHNMNEYQHSVFRSHLEKEYTVPASRKTVKQLAILQPTLKAVELHEYPNEHAVVLMGDYLWFCHKIRLGEANARDVNTPAQNITRRSIQFSFTPSLKKESLLDDDDCVLVTLFSHFSKPVIKKMRIKKEPYSFSLRQMQLAKHTPTEIIQLACWSAMLEWHPKCASEHNPSERFKELTQFLQEAVKAVPLESVFFAIAYSGDDTAVECTKAIRAYHPTLQPSEMMIEGTELASRRMYTGMRADVMSQAGLAITQAISSLECTYAVQASVIASSSLQPQVASAPPAQKTKSATKPSYSKAMHHKNPKPHAATSGAIPPHPLPSAFSMEFQVPVPILPVPVFSMPMPPALTPEVAELAGCLIQLWNSVFERGLRKIQNGIELDVVGRINIEQVYPVFPSQRQALHACPLQSPVEILRDARKKLADFVEEAQAFEELTPEQKSTKSTQEVNEQMLILVREVKHSLRICTALLGAFMEQQIHLPLLKSPVDTAKVLSSKTASVAVGVWALFSLSLGDLEKMLSHTQGNALLVEIADYMSGIFGQQEKELKADDRKYAGKLQFLLQGIKTTVTCSSQYISYSLERQLCSNLKFDKSISVRELIRDWDEIFKGDALSLIATSHRPLLARWLKWAVLIHDLREALAKYTCVGVIGLINSGKSQLVNTLFKIQTLVGTTASRRTTVPFLYNLDGTVDGLDVIDFPGVDDSDPSVPELAKVLIGLAQVVIFVVDYRKISSGSAKAWLQALQAEDVPVLVCLTYADRLYAECMKKEGNPNPTEYKKQEFGRELFKMQEKMGPHPSRTMEFYCFSEEADSSLPSEGLKEVGIKVPLDVGEWLVKTFRSKLDQSDLATRLERFIHSHDD